MSAEDIRARLAAATPGPWEFVGPDIQNVPNYSSDTPTPWKQVMESGVSCGSYCQGGSVNIDIAETDEAFIAHAPADIARLLAAVDAMTALADKWQEQFPYKASELRTALTTALGDGA